MYKLIRNVLVALVLALSAAVPAGSAPTAAGAQCSPIKVYLYEHINYGGAVLKACPAPNFDGSYLGAYKAGLPSWKLDGWNDITSSTKVDKTNVRARYYDAANYGTLMQTITSTNVMWVWADFGVYNDRLSSIRIDQL